tara:strand:+ start:133 stop:513 length:381 start_codon:yes stop_codon:yes gene_type:complete
MEFILYGLFFITGWLAHAVVAYVLSLGSSVMLFQRTIEDSLLVVGRTYEGYVVAREYKMEHLRLAGKSDKELEIERKMDATTMASIQATLIRNILHNVPSKFEGLIRFNDWDSAMDEVTRIIKERR